MAYIVDAYRIEEGLYKALVVANALYCGGCELKEDPVELPKLE